MAEKLKDVDYFMAVTTSSACTSARREDEAYKRQSPIECRRLSGTMTFALREIGGANLVAIDNSYYLFNGRQLELLKAEASKGGC